MMDKAEPIPMFVALDWPQDAHPGVKYLTLRCFGCYREYRGPKNGPYCWACTQAREQRDHQ